MKKQLVLCVKAIQGAPRSYSCTPRNLQQTLRYRNLQWGPTPQQHLVCFYTLAIQDHTQDLQDHPPDPPGPPPGPCRTNPTISSTTPRTSTPPSSLPLPSSLRHRCSLCKPSSTILGQPTCAPNLAIPTARPDNKSGQVTSRRHRPQGPFNKPT